MAEHIISLQGVTKEFDTKGGKVVALKDIKLVDLTDDAIYVWMSDTMIMPIPRHAFRNADDMKESYKFIREKIKEKGGKIDE